MSKIQNESVKSEAELLAAGGAKAQLINDNKIYVTADGLNKRLDEAIIDGDIGGGGVGGINYIENFDAEKDTGGWSTYQDAAQAEPEDGTGGTPNVTLTRTTTAPLRGVGSFLFSKDAADRQGEGFSYPLIIDSADRGKIVKISFDYEVSADYQTGDVNVFLRDNTNATLVRLFNQEIDARDNSLVSTFSSYIQTPIDSVDYTLIFHVATTNALAYELKVDNVRVGPLEESILPNFDGAVGDIVHSMLDEATFQSQYGAHWVLADGRDVTGSKYADLTGNTSIPDLRGVTLRGKNNGRTGTGANPDGDLALGTFQDDQFQSHDHAFTNQPINQSFTVNVGSSIIVSAHGNTTVNNAPPTGLAGGNETRMKNVTVNYFIKINEAQGGSKFDIQSGREIYTQIKQTTVQSIPHNTNTVIDFNLVQNDTTGSFNPTTNEYVVPESGVYNISGYFALDGGNQINNGRAFAFVSINGGDQQVFGVDDSSTTSGYALFNISGSRSYKLTKGDVLNFQVSQNTTVSQDLLTTEVTIFRNNTLNSQIQPTETVAAAYTTNSGQVIPFNLSTVIVFEDKRFDTHNKMNVSNGFYEIAINGKYAVDATVWFNSNALTDSVCYMEILIDNGVTQFVASGGEVNVNSIDRLSANVSDIVDVKAGDKVAVRVYQAGPHGNSQALLSAGIATSFSIIKVGN